MARSLGLQAWTTLLALALVLSGAVHLWVWGQHARDLDELRVRLSDDTDELDSGGGEGPLGYERDAHELSYGGASYGTKVGRGTR
jgi:hypothetical protein